MRTDTVDKIEKRQIVTLAATGKSKLAIAKAMGRDPKTIRNVLKNPDMMIVKADIEAKLACKFEELTSAILDSVTEDDLEKASLQQKAISAATMLDKARLIRGQSTQNVHSLHISAVIAADKAMAEDEP